MRDNARDASRGHINLCLYDVRVNQRRCASLSGIYGWVFDGATVIADAFVIKVEVAAEVSQFVVFVWMRFFSVERWDVEVWNFALIFDFCLGKLKDF